MLRSPERVASVAEVAGEAGLAKGTVYLYFPSKEELLLAVHERGIGGFFREVIALVERDGPVRIDDMLVLVQRHLIAPPLFLPLAARCFGLMAHSVPASRGAGVQGPDGGSARARRRGARAALPGTRSG